MSATKVKMLQIKRLVTHEPVKRKKRVMDAVVKPEEVNEMRQSGGVLDWLTDFVMVGGDFV